MESLSIGASIALFLLGVFVWMRDPHKRGNVLFAFLSLSFACWSSVLVQHLFGAQSGLFARILSTLALAFAPAIAAHASAVLARRRFVRAGIFFYGVSTLIFAGLHFEPHLFFSSGLLLAVCALAVSVTYVAIELFPLLHSTTMSVLDRRRVAYGSLLLMLFLLTAWSALPMPHPFTFGAPLFSIGFLVISLLAYTRASLLNVDMPPVEAFYILLLTFAFLLFVRAGTREDRSVVAIGATVIGFFGAYAVKTCRSERRRRVDAESDAQVARRLDEAKSDFVDMVSHQLRGPLGGIRAASAMLADGEYGSLTEKANIAATQIENAATRLLSLAETFLNASRVELGSYESVRVPTDVKEEIRNAIEEMSPLAIGKKLALDTTCRTCIPPLVRVDRDVLRNVLYNLLDNALKYTARGSVTVTCSINHGDLAIDVVDTGKGMTQEELGEVFKKFYRGSFAKEREIDGTGLGLYVVRRLVLATGGTVTADSSGPGKGSVFSVHLPTDSV